MGFALELKRMTAEEFLAWDKTQTVKHEFVRGEVFAMAGASERHIAVVGNLYVALRNHLRGTPCRPLPSEMKLRVEAADCFYYPDLMVTCGEAAAEHQHQKTDAVLVVEVLSPSTRRFDLMLKRERLQRAGCRHYWVFDPDEPSVLAFTLDGDVYVESGRALGDELFSATEPFEISFTLRSLTGQS